MALHRDFYFCNHCKKVVRTIEALYFVEEGGQRGFCSEKCIESYFTGHIDFFVKEERRIRTAKDVFEDELQNFLDDPKIMERALKTPDEIFRVENDLKEEIYTLITHMQDEKIGTYHVVIICFVFDKKPSFVLLSTATKRADMLKEFTIGEAIKNPKNYFKSGEESEHEGLNLPTDVMNSLEHQKSVILAELLSIRKDTDIAFEDFHKYDKYISLTLEASDETFLTQIDNEVGQFVYIKSFEIKGVAFYYFVIGLTFQGVKVDGANVIPVLSFPTVDGEIYRHFSKGKLYSGSMKS